MKLIKHKQRAARLAHRLGGSWPREVSKCKKWKAVLAIEEKMVNHIKLGISAHSPR